MKNERTLATILGIGAGLAGALGGCRNPEQIGYEGTFARQSASDGSLEFWAEHPNGINRVEIYDTRGNLLFVDQVNQYGENLNPTGHLVIPDRYLPGNLVIKVYDPNNGKFGKELENPCH